MIEIINLIILIFLAWFLVTQKHDGPIRLFSGRRDQLILDSCALIDGRIVEIVNNGFLVSELIIPQFILNELQLLADGSDSHKRERARFGLDIAHQLQDAAPVNVVIDRTVFAEIPATDDKLVALAKKLKARLYTTDFNLGKVAAVEGVSVLNVNSLSQSLRPISLPGESLKIKIIQKGSNHGQGVGYLDDGTMIVVDGGARHVGKVVPVTVTRMHQTVAGKMVFGQVKEEPRQHQVPAPEHDQEAPESQSHQAQQQRPQGRQQPQAAQSQPPTGHSRRRSTVAEERLQDAIEAQAGSAPTAVPAQPRRRMAANPAAQAQAIAQRMNPAAVQKKLHSRLSGMRTRRPKNIVS